MAHEALALAALAAATLIVSTVNAQEPLLVVLNKADDEAALVEPTGWEVIDRADGSVISIPTGAGAEGIDVTPDGREAWVSNRSPIGRRRPPSRWARCRSGS